MALVNTPSKYMKVVQELSTGLGAIKLNSNVKGITIKYCNKTRSYGARHFWRKEMPKLKFQNPDINFNVILVEEKIKPLMILDFANTTKELDISGMDSEGVFNKLINSL